MQPCILHAAAVRLFPYFINISVYRFKKIITYEFENVQNCLVNKYMYNSKIE